MTQSLSEPMPAMGGLVRLLPRKKALSTTTILFQAFPLRSWLGVGQLGNLMDDLWMFVALCGMARSGLTQWEVPSQDAAVCAGWRLFQAEDGGRSLKRLLVLPWFFHPYAKCKSHQITTVVDDISITYIIYQ